MQHIQPLQQVSRLLYDAAAIRTLERAAMQQLPKHALMQAAAGAIYRLGRALYPHARQIWVTCGPGNNGGDGLLAAAAWHKDCVNMGVEVCVTWTGDESRLPDDARFALTEARQAGVRFVPGPPQHFDLAVDALLGLGVKASPNGLIGAQIAHLQASRSPVLCVDLPSGLHPDTGQWLNACPAQPNGPRHTLTFLGLKPGLFTASGREVAGDIWLDNLDERLTVRPDAPPCARLLTPPVVCSDRRSRHDAHKGSHGDLVVLGGQDVRLHGQGMTGAALLAARAGLQAGAGRVYTGLLGPQGTTPSLAVDNLWPELMFRHPDELLRSDLLRRATVVCGCGGGQEVRSILPAVLLHSTQLVLDADALNAIADTREWQLLLQQRASQGNVTVLTPHPLEAARLLSTTASAVQAQRLTAAKQLAQKFQCTVVLKGSGTILVSQDRLPSINPTGNALLATAGTGDVLAGMLGGYWCAQGASSYDAMRSELAWHAASQAVYTHGKIASEWPEGSALTASHMLDRIPPL